MWEPSRSGVFQDENAASSSGTPGACFPNLIPTCRSSDVFPDLRPEFHMPLHLAELERSDAFMPASGVIEPCARCSEPSSKPPVSVKPDRWEKARDCRKMSRCGDAMRNLALRLVSSSLLSIRGGLGGGNHGARRSVAQTGASCASHIAGWKPAAEIAGKGKTAP